MAEIIKCDQCGKQQNKYTIATNLWFIVKSGWVDRKDFCSAECVVNYYKKQC